MSTIAIHVVWTAYLTWPPGDERGHWSSLFDLYGHLIEQGHKLNVPDPVTKRRAMSLAKEAPRLLTPQDQDIVAQTTGELLADELRDLKVFAGAIERTHVHLLLGATHRPIARVVGMIKGRTSSEVIARGSERGRERTWTDGYWKVFLFEQRSVPHVRSYIEKHNERRGMVGAPYEWIRP